MNKNSKTIYVDLDDVLCHTARHFLVIVEREFGKKISYERLTSFDVGHSCGLTAEERDELYRIVHRPEELASMTPMDEAVGVLGQWREQGFEIAIVTGRPPDSIDVSLEWLGRHRIAFDSFTCVDKYARFTNTTGNAITLADLSQRAFCWAVEDSLPMAHFLAREMEVPVALIDRPWNGSDVDPIRIRRCRDWPAISAAIPALTNRGAQ